MSSPTKLLFRRCFILAMLLPLCNAANHTAAARAFVAQESAEQITDPFDLGPDFPDLSALNGNAQEKVDKDSPGDTELSNAKDASTEREVLQPTAPEQIQREEAEQAADRVARETDDRETDDRETDNTEESEDTAETQADGGLVHDEDANLQSPADQLAKLAPKQIAWIEVEGPIFGRFHWYLLNRLDWAKQQNAEVIVIDLTSPGGGLDLSVELAREIAAIDWATTICFIRREAISGGAITALGADYIVMQEGAMIGDAGPIELRPGGVFEHAPEKIVSYLAPIMGELAQQHDRPKLLAEAMVDRKLIVYEAVDTQLGQRVFISDKTLKEAPERFLDAKQVDETGQNRFLTVSAARAQELRLVEHVVADDQALVALLGSPKIARTKLTGTDKAVYLLNRPWLTALLLIVGLIGIYLEAAAPGISVAGLTAVICFGIFFWSHALGGTTGILEILLFALGVGCIACELLLLPGFGIFGISGIGLIAASLVMATQTFVIPETNADWQALQMNSVVVLGAMLFVVVLGVGQILLFDSLPGLNLFRLQPPVDAPAEFDETPPQLTQVSPAVIPLEIGMSGAAESDLRPAGKVNINGHLIDVVTEGDYVEKGATVSVIRVEGNRITVRVES